MKLTQTAHLLAGRPKTIADAAALPANAFRQIDALAQRAGTVRDLPKASVDAFDSNKAPTTPTGPSNRDNGIVASLGHDPSTAPVAVGFESRFEAAKGDVTALMDQVRAASIAAGVPMGFGSPNRTSGLDLVAARTAAIRGADDGSFPAAPGLSTPGDLLGSRTSGDYARSRQSAGDSKSEPTASERVVKKLEELAAAVPAAIKDFAAGAAGAVLPFIPGLATSIGLSNRNDEDVRNTANGIQALADPTARTRAQDPDARKQRTDAGDDRDTGPSASATERAAGRRDGLVNPVGTSREIDPAKLAAATIIAIMSKVNPSGVRDTAPQGPLVPMTSGLSDPPAPTPVRGGKIVVAGGPPRSGGDGPGSPR